MNVVFLGLGGNMGNRLEFITLAESAIEIKCGIILKRSAIYETQAWGSKSKLNYLNRVIKIETKLSAFELLKVIAEIEKKLGRKRGKTRFSDRTIDIDILFFNTDLINTKNLQIPHPRAHLRKFVLVPLLEIEKKLVHPELNKRIQALMLECRDKQWIKPFKPLQKTLYICIEGNIGSGKTTLAKALAKELNAVLLPELFEDKTLLPLFYKEPQTYAFALEFSFLLQRFEQITRELKKNPPILISDFCFYKSFWFSKINLSQKEYYLFKKQFTLLANLLPKPDLMVVQNTGIKTLLKNIKTRARAFEKGIKAQYLNKIETSLNIGLSEVSEVKQLNLSLKKYNAKTTKASIKTIKNYLKENFGYQH